MAPFIRDGVDFELPLELGRGGIKSRGDSGIGGGAGKAGVIITSATIGESTGMSGDSLGFKVASLCFCLTWKPGGKDDVGLLSVFDV